MRATTTATRPCLQSDEPGWALIDEAEYEALGAAALPAVRILGRCRYVGKPDAREPNLLFRLRPGKEAEYVVLVSSR